MGAQQRPHFLTKTYTFFLFFFLADIIWTGNASQSYRTTGTVLVRDGIVECIGECPPPPDVIDTFHVTSNLGTTCMFVISKSFLFFFFLLNFHSSSTAIAWSHCSGRWAGTDDHGKRERSICWRQCFHFWKNSCIWCNPAFLTCGSWRDAEWHYCWCKSPTWQWTRIRSRRCVADVRIGFLVLLLFDDFTPRDGRVLTESMIADHVGLHVVREKHRTIMHFIF